MTAHIRHEEVPSSALCAGRDDAVLGFVGPLQNPPERSLPGR